MGQKLLHQQLLSNRCQNSLSLIFFFTFFCFCQREPCSAKSKRTKNSIYVQQALSLPRTIEGANDYTLIHTLLFTSCNRINRAPVNTNSLSQHLPLSHTSLSLSLSLSLLLFVVTILVGKKKTLFFATNVEPNVVLSLMT